ncbi:MAG: PAS domain-containing protein [Deltaproteobacteria bacterium]|nr:PAS domain-containing protein [Deltaproteobacteria bacterium]
MMETKKKTDLSDEVKLDNHTLEQLSFQLSQSSAFLNNFLDSFAVLATNENGFITTGNKTAENLFLFSTEELLSRHISVLMEEPQEDLEFIPQVGRDAGLEISCKKKKGTVFSARVRRASFKWKKNESLSWLFFFEDMKYEKSMKHWLFEPLQFEKLLSELFASFVHIQDSEFDDKIYYALQRIVHVFETDRCHLLQYRYDTKEYVFTHSWASEGLPNIKIGITSGPADVPWIYTNFARSQKIFQFNSIDDLPDEAEVDKKFFRLERNRS